MYQEGEREGRSAIECCQLNNKCEKPSKVPMYVRGGEVARESVDAKFARTTHAHNNLPIGKSTVQAM